MNKGAISDTAFVFTEDVCTESAKFVFLCIFYELDIGHANKSLLFLVKVTLRLLTAHETEAWKVTNLLFCKLD